MQPYTIDEVKAAVKTEASQKRLKNLEESYETVIFEIKEAMKRGYREIDTVSAFDDEEITKDTINRLVSGGFAVTRARAARRSFRVEW